MAQRGYLLFLCLLSVIGQGFAQNHPCALKLNLSLVDRESDTRKPVPFALVHLTGQPPKSSNTQGKVSWNYLCAGSYSLRGSCLGYEPLSLELELTKNIDTTLYLSPTRHLLHDVVISGHQELTTPSVRKEDTNFMPSQDVGSLLKNLPGLSVIKSGHSIQKPVIHSLYGHRIAVVNEGVLHKDQDWSAHHDLGIDALGASYIEVLKGSDALKYTPGAVGGVVLLHHAPLPVGAKAPTGKFAGTFETNGYRSSLTGSISAPIRQHQAVETQLTYKQGAQVRSPNYVLSNSASQEIAGKIRFGNTNASKKRQTELLLSQLHRTLGILRASHIGNRRDLDEAFSRKTPFFVQDQGFSIVNPKQRVAHYTVKLKNDQTLSESQHWHTQYAYQINHRREYENRRARQSDIPINHLLLHSHQINSHINLSQDNQDFTLGVQPQIQYNRNAQGSIPYLDDYDEQSLGSYALVDVRWNTRTKNRLSLRYDYTARRNYLSFEEKEVQKRYHTGAVVLNMHRQLSASSHLSQDISWVLRPPHAVELYSLGIHHSSAAIEEGDPNLSVERAVKYSALLHAEFDFLHIDLTPYCHYFQGFIYLSPHNTRLTLRGAFPVFQYLQTNALLYGADAQLWVGLLPSLHYESTLFLPYGQNLSQRQALIDIPPFHLTQSLQWRAPFRLQASLTHDYTAQQTRYPAETLFVPPPKAYHLWHVELKHRWPRKPALSASIRMENIFNKRYRSYLNRFRYFADEPGRSMMLNIQLRF